ncbi:conserved hypothetical protein [Vibrio chagasii]|nr:conserved hypothetical protein [Vibrio chagasii]
MKICGIDIQGSTVTICIIHMGNEEVKTVEGLKLKFTVSDPSCSNSLRDFTKSFNEFLVYQNVEQIVFKEKKTKGRFAGSANGFRIEAAIQVSCPCSSVIFPTVEFNSFSKNKIVEFNANTYNLNQYQESAFYVAHAYAYYQSKKQSD